MKGGGGVRTGVGKGCCWRDGALRRGLVERNRYK